jgi:hypothetical protein
MRGASQVIFAAASGAALLVAIDAAAAWSGNVQVASIESSNVSTDGVWLSFTSDPFPAHTCPNRGGQYRLGGGAANVSRMLSLATESLRESRNIAAYWGGECSGGYPVLVGLMLK